MFLSFNPDMEYAVLCLGAVLVFGSLHRWVWRGPRYGTTTLLLWLLVAVVLGCGWLFVEESTNRERMQMEQIVTGYAPTYAQEMARMGHQEMTTEASADYPHYWQLVSAEKRWLAANPAVGNIYTLRKLKDGHIVRIVDSTRVRPCPDVGRVVMCA